MDNHNCGHHDSSCTGHYCNCDDRYYGHSSGSGSTIVGIIVLILAFSLGLVLPPLGAIIMFIWVFSK
jgi:hypothetical protein